MPGEASARQAQHVREDRARGRCGQVDERARHRRSERGDPPQQQQERPRGVEEERAHRLAGEREGCACERKHSGQPGHGHDEQVRRETDE